VPTALERSRRLVLPELIGRGRRAHPERAALVFGAQERSHAALHERAQCLATVLAQAGVRRGDRVALLLHNGLEFPESLLACHALGAVAVPVNFRLAADEIAHILRDAGARVLIRGEDSSAPPVDGLVLTTGQIYEDAIASADAHAEPAWLREDDPALMCYTSGTTGRPKGAILTHGNLVASTLSWIHEMRAGEDDVWLSGQPLFHIGGINGLLPFLALGATSIVTPTTGFDPEAALERIARHGVSMCIFVPTQWDLLCRAEGVQSLERGRLRVAMWAASPAARATLELMAATFPQAEIVSAYGQTEMAGATTLLKGADSVRKMGSVGRPMLGVELRVVDDDLRDVPVGAIGEIVYRGPTVMAGYHDDPDASAEAFAGDWFHSGDLATRDEEGYLWLVDRKKDLIISGGENVYPAEVERVLLEHEAVADAAVVGMAHPRWVETPLAFVVAAGDVDEDALIAHCRERLAGFKKPSAVVFVDALPRNAAGKVLKRELRASAPDLYPAQPTGGPET
jgi:acyl-CoA synthetase (AMP-forming)/AMP-acid ligase II